MPYSDKAILVDVNGKPIPQIWDEAGDQFVPYEGNVTLSGSLAESLQKRFVQAERFSRFGPLAAATEESILTVDGAHGADIEYIELASDVDNKVRFAIKSLNPQGGVTGEMNLISANGVGLAAVRPDKVRAEKSAFFELVVDETGRYKLLGRRQVPMGAGFSVSVANDDPTTAYNAGVIVFFNRMA